MSPAGGAWCRPVNSTQSDSDTKCLCRYREIGEEPMLVSCITAHAQQASAAHGGEGFHLQAIFELQRAVQLAEPRWAGPRAEREPSWKSIRPQSGILHGAVRLDLEGGGSACGQIGINGFGQLQVHGAAGRQVQLLFFIERQAALGVEVGVFAGDVERVKIKAVGKRGMDAALAFQMHAGNGCSQLLQTCFAVEFTRMRQRPFDGDGAGQCGLACEALHMSRFQQAADVEVGEIEFGLGRIFAVESCLAVQVHPSAFQSEWLRSADGAIGGVSCKNQCAQGFTAQCQAAERYGS